MNLSRLTRFFNPTASSEAIGIVMLASTVVAVLAKATTHLPRPIRSIAQSRLAQQPADANLWKDLSRALDANNRPLTLVLPDRLVRWTQLNVPDLPEKERRQALAFLVAEAENLPVDDLICDYIDVPDLKRPSTEPLVYCASARLSEIQPLVRALMESRCRLNHLVPIEQALRHILRWCEPESDTVAVLVYMMPNASKIIVAQRDCLYLFRSSRTGHETFQQDSESAALALGLDIQRTLDFFETQFKAPPAQRVWIIPHDHRLNTTIQQSLSAQLQQPVKCLEPAQMEFTLGDDVPFGMAALALAATVPMLTPS